MRKILHDYALGIIFIVQWVIFTIVYIIMALMGGKDTVQILEGLFENLQSETFQVAQMIIFSAYFIYVGSQQSKDSDERLEQKIDEILKKMDTERNSG